jgi:hypothetical protein
MHQRKAIRHAVKNILIAADICGGRVFANRPLPGWTEDLPYIHVYMSEESSEITDRVGNSDRYRRSPELHIEIIGGIYQIDAATGVVTKISQTLDDEMDDIAEEVEAAVLATAVFTDPATGETSYSYLVDPASAVNVAAETADDFKMTGTSQKLSADGDMIIGSTVIKFEPVYHTNYPSATAPETSDAFLIGEVGLDINADGKAELTADAYIPTT